MAIWGATTTVQAGRLTMARCGIRFKRPRSGLPLPASSPGSGSPTASSRQKFTHFDEVTLEASTDRAADARASRREDPRRHRRRGARLRRRPPEGAHGHGSASSPASCTRSRPTSPGRSCRRRCSARSTSSLVVPDAPVAAAAPRRCHDPRSTDDRRPRCRRSSPTSTPCSGRCSPPTSNITLNAISTALEGRGDQLGQDLVHRRPLPDAGQPADPAILQDLRLTTQVVEHLRRRDPELAQILRNTIKTTGTLQDRRQQLADALHRRHVVLRHRPRLPRDNGDNIIRLGQVSAPTARMLAALRPGVPVPRSADSSGAASVEAQAFRGFTLHIVLETLPNQPRGYTAGRPAGVRRRPRPQLPAPARTRRGARPTRCGTSRTSTTG